MAPSVFASDRLSEVPGRAAVARAAYFSLESHSKAAGTIVSNDPLSRSVARGETLTRSLFAVSTSSATANKSSTNVRKPSMSAKGRR